MLSAGCEPCAREAKMRPILNVKTKTQSVELDVHAKPKVTTRLAGAHLEARIKRKRNADYIQAVTKLDAGAHTADRKGLEQVIAAIETEFADLEISQRPIG